MTVLTVYSLKGHNQIMSEYFKDALKDFTFDMACGAAIRHLMELGYSEEEMLSRLDFPISADKLHEAVVKYRKKAEEEAGSFAERYEMVLEYDEYGHRSYRRVPSSGHPPDEG